MSDFSMTRGTHINAAPEQVRAWIQDFHRWEDWSPWHGLDPNMQITYSGPTSGVGAQQAWSGNKEAGAGSMEVTGSTPERVDVRLDFLKPIKATNHVHFDLTPSAAGGTDVLWTMTAQQSPIGRLFYRLFRVEKKLAADFDRGLASLKSHVEASSLR